MERNNYSARGNRSHTDRDYDDAYAYGIKPSYEINLNLLKQGALVLKNSIKCVDADIQNAGINKKKISENCKKQLEKLQSIVTSDLQTNDGSKLPVEQRVSNVSSHNFKIIRKKRKRMKKGFIKKVRNIFMSKNKKSIESVDNNMKYFTSVIRKTNHSVARVRADKNLTQDSERFQSNIHKGMNAFDRRGIKNSDKKVAVKVDYNTRVLKQYGKLVQCFDYRDRSASTQSNRVHTSLSNNHRDVPEAFIKRSSKNISFDLLPQTTLSSNPKAYTSGERLALAIQNSKHNLKSLRANLNLSKTKKPPKYLNSLFQ
ncbi:unnamed protein product [Moneuplotes crassus]|uniref:Uncharacterized protein n=1 Tax=Euplotes crassus TaxID=5936 RepID=A0AAD1UIY3_EUPCR|nr:unnamed protein product [Moneuplotes crassus]